MPMHQELPDQFVNTIKLLMVRIKKGTFTMGAPAQDKDKFDDEVAQHRVKITRDFYLGATEVTRSQFKQFVDEEGYQTEAETDGRGGEGYNQETGKLEGPKPIYNRKHPGRPLRLRARLSQPQYRVPHRAPARPCGLRICLSF